MSSTKGFASNINGDVNWEMTGGNRVWYCDVVRPSARFVISFINTGKMALELLVQNPLYDMWSMILILIFEMLCYRSGGVRPFRPRQIRPRQIRYPIFVTDRFVPWQIHYRQIRPLTYSLPTDSSPYIFVPCRFIPNILFYVIWWSSQPAVAAKG